MIRQTATLGECLRQLAERRVRPTAVLYLHLGQLEWTPAQQVRERLTTSRTPDGYWDAFLVDTDQETPNEPAGIYLFGTDGKAYRSFEIEATQAALTREATRSRHKQAGRCTVIHPEHDFLTFDDLLQPTKMTVWLTSLRFESDLEDNRRCGIAQEIKWALKERGCSLEITFERETEAPVVSDERIITIQEGDL
jgi:hypothetical protein